MTSTDAGCTATDHLVLKQTKQSARGIFYDPGPSTQGSLKAGTTLLRLHPLATIVSTDLIRDYCSGCGANRGPDTFGHCQQCRFTRYCSEECKKHDWTNGHAYECAPLAALRRRQKQDKRQEVRMPLEDVRLSARLVWMKRHVVSQAGNANEPWPCTTSFNDLNSHVKHHEKNHRQQLVQQTQQVRLLLESSVPNDARRQAEYDFNEHFNLRNDEHLSSIISTVWTNVHAWSNSSLDTIGLALSPQAAMLNHSCMPNVNLVFPSIGTKNGKSPPTLHLVASRDVMPGQELYITYLDLADSRAARQEKLRLGYGFECRCRSCGSQDVDPREVMWCPSRGDESASNQQCSGWVPKPKSSTSTISSRTVTCETCKCNFEINDVDLLIKTEKAIKSIQNQLQSPTQTLQQWPQILNTHLKTLLKLYPPCSYPLLELTEQIKTHLVDLFNISPTSILTMTILQLQFLHVAGIKAGKSKIYSPGHPKRAIALVELVQWLLMDFGTDGESESSSLFDLGSVVPQPPTSVLQRAQWSNVVLNEARDVAHIAFGREENGGLLGVKVEDLSREVREWFAQVGRGA